jgi:hypothetical protein
MAKTQENAPANNGNKRSIGDVIGTGSKWISATALVEQRRVFDLVGGRLDADGKYGETVIFDIVLHGEFDTPEEANKSVSMTVNPVRLFVLEALNNGETFENIMCKNVMTSKGREAVTFVEYTAQEQAKDTPF